MAKYKSRATRCSEACSVITEDVQAKLEEIASELRDGSLNISAAKVSLGNLLIDTSTFEELKDEIENWKSNMEGTNLESTNKYQEVNDCFDALDYAISNLESVDLAIEIVEESNIEIVAQDIDDLATQIETAISDLGGVEFPGMY